MLTVTFQNIITMTIIFIYTFLCPAIFISVFITYSANSGFLLFVFATFFFMCMSTTFRNLFFFLSPIFYLYMPQQLSVRFSTFHQHCHQCNNPKNNYVVNNSLFVSVIHTTHITSTPGPTLKNHTAPVFSPTVGLSTFYTQYHNLYLDFRNHICCLLHNYHNII